MFKFDGVQDLTRSSHIEDADHGSNLARHLGVHLDLGAPAKDCSRGEGSRAGSFHLKQNERL